MSDRPIIDPRRIEILDDEVVEMLRGKSAAQRVAMTLDAERTMRLMLEAHLRGKYPTWTSRQIADEIAQRRHHGSS